MAKIINNLQSYAVASIILTVCTSAAAAIDLTGLSAEQAGLKIAQTADAQSRGYGNVSADMTMTNSSRGGHDVVRQMRSKALEVAGDGDRSLTIFVEPRDVKGSALLTHGHRGKADEQWLYLPALRRVKRIKSNSQNAPFMGSEFAYEDLNTQDISQYNFKLLAEEQLNGVATYKIERTPKNADSGYSRQISWVEKQPLRMLKVDYYDRKNSLLKVLTFSNYVQHQQKYWRAETMLMRNQQTGKSTSIKLANIKFNDPSVKVSDFNSNALQRAH